MSLNIWFTEHQRNEFSPFLSRNPCGVGRVVECKVFFKVFYTFFYTFFLAKKEVPKMFLYLFLYLLDNSRKKTWNREKRYKKRYKKAPQAKILGEIIKKKWSGKGIKKRYKKKKV